MKLFHIFIVFLLIFEDVLSQRQVLRAELPLDLTANQPASVARSRGRARFSVTPEFEQVQSDYAKVAKEDSEPPRRRVATPTRTQAPSNRRTYEVEEVLDDIPNDSPRRYASKPRVVTEMRFEAVNAPRDNLFNPEPPVVPETKADELSRNTAPPSPVYQPPESEAKSTSEETDGNHISSTEGSSESSSKSNDQTTEQEMMSKELMRHSPEAVQPTKQKVANKRFRLPQTTETSEQPSQKPRTRTRKRPVVPVEPSKPTSVKEPSSGSSNRKEEFLRKQEFNRSNIPRPVIDVSTKRIDVLPQQEIQRRKLEDIPTRNTEDAPRRMKEVNPMRSQEELPRNNFRASRRRGEAVQEQTKEPDRRSRGGPSVFQDGDLEPSRTRTGRRAVNTNRRFPSRTATTEPTNSTIEPPRGRVDRRQGRTFTREPTKVEETPKETTTFISRRRPSRPTAQSNPTAISNPRSRITVETESTTTKVQNNNIDRSRSRSRSRFNPTNIDEQKLEVLPLFEAEPKTVRQQTSSRRRGKQPNNNSNSNTFEKRKDPIESRSRTVSVSRSESVTEARPVKFQPTIKETVQSEVSEVISSRKVTRPKARGNKKSEVVLPKVRSEDLPDESDNYPEPFKALLHKQHKQNDVKDSKHKGSRSLAAEDVTVARSSTTPVNAPVESDVVAFTPDLGSSTTAASVSIVSDGVSSDLAVELHPGSSSVTPPSISLAENEINSSPDNLPPQPPIKPTSSPVVRPTRRRFSLATKPPQDSPSTKKTSFIPSRKPTSRPYKKYTTSDTLSVSLNSATQRYHARFNSRPEVDLGVIQQDKEKPTTYRRSFPTKSSGYLQNARKVTSKVIHQDRPERKTIPIKGNKLVDSGQNTPSAPSAGGLKKHGSAQLAAHRYSSRYRGGADLGSRNAQARTTVVPVYVPTVPSITPPTSVLPTGAHTEENDLGLQVISIDEPANSLFSDNLVVGDSSPGSNATSVPKEDNEKKKSILERIINSLTAISTTTTTAPPKDVTNNRLAKKRTTDKDNTSSAILKIASKKTKPSPSPNQLAVIDVLKSTTDKIGSDQSSERPTTVIERIIDSLSAIQAIDSSTIDPIQVGTSANTFYIAPTKSMTFKRTTTAPQPTLIPARSVGDYVSSSPIPGDTLSMFLKLLNLGTARSTNSQPQLYSLTSTPTPSTSGVSNRNSIPSSTLFNSFSRTEPTSIRNTNTPTITFSPTEQTTSFPTSSFITGSTPFRIPSTTFSSISKTEQTPLTRPPPLVRQFTIPTTEFMRQSTFTTERNDPTSFRIPPTLFSTDRPLSSTFVTNPVPTQQPFITTTHNNRNDVELLPTVSSPGIGRLISTNAPQSQTTVAISLADFLASLNQRNPTTSQTNIPTIIPVTSTLPTIIDARANSVESTTRFRDMTSTLLPSTVTTIASTMVPITTEKQNRGLPENFTVSPESVRIISANDLPQSTFSPDVLSIIPVETTTNPPTTSTSTTTMTETTTNGITTTEPNDLTTITVTDRSNANIITTTDIDNNIITTTDRPVSQAQPSQSMSMSRLIADFMRDNDIKPPQSDYYVFAVLPNNTIVRKRPRAFALPQDSPYIVVGVYPNNTVVHKYPNGTVVPEEPVIQVSGFDTRANPPPLPDLTSNNVTTSTSSTTSPTTTSTQKQGGDHIVDNTSTRMDNIVQSVVSSSIEANLIPLDSTNSSSSTTASPTTPNFENSINQFKGILGGKTIEEFNNLLNKSTGNIDVNEVEVLVTTRPNTEGVDIDNNVISTRPRPEKVIISTTPGSISNNLNDIRTTTIVPTTGSIDTTTTIPTTESTVVTTTLNPTTFRTTTLNPTTFRPSSLSPTSFRTTTSNPTTFRTQAPIRTNSRVQASTLPPFLANLLSTAIVQETNPPNVPTIFGISRTTSNRPTTTTEPFTITTATAPPTEVFEVRTNQPRVQVIPVTPANPAISTPLDVQAILRLLEEYTGSTITPRTVPRQSRTTTGRTLTTDLENEIDSSSRLVELITESSRRRFRTTTVSTTIPTTTIRTTTEPTTVITTTLLPTTTTAVPITTLLPRTRSTPQRTTTMVPTTTFVPITEVTTRRTPARIRNIEVSSTTEQFSPTINPVDIDTNALIARVRNKPLTEQQKQDLATLEALENEQKALLEQLSLLTNLNLNQNKPTNRPDSNSNSLANRIIAFASDRDRTTTENISKVTFIEPDNNRKPKVAVINGKAVPVDELLKKINDNGINSVSSTYGSSNDAILAAILKEQGIGPTTPEVFNNVYSDLTTTTRRTTQRPRTTTTRGPGPIMQGLSWILNAIGPQNPPTNAPPRRFRPNPPATPRPTEPASELLTQGSQRTTQSTPAPTTTVGIEFKRPVNSLSDLELQSLISQLEEIQKDPRKAKELDLSNLRKLQSMPGSSQSQTRLRNNVQLVHSAEQGNIASTPLPTAAQADDIYNTYARNRKAKSTTALPVVSVSNSLSAEDFDIDDEPVVVVTRVPPQARPRPTVAPVQLNPIRGIDSGLGGAGSGGGGAGQQDGQVRGSLITAAVNVTRAISTFLGSAIQGAAQSFQAIIGSGSRQVGNYFGSGSIANRLG